VRNTAVDVKRSPVGILITCLLMTALLNGCSPPPIDITVTKVDGRVIAKLEQKWGLIAWLSDPKVPCVEYVRLQENLPYGKQRTLWRAKATNAAEKVDNSGTCIQLSEFTVGVAPKGFVEETRLVPVPPNTKVEIQIYGIGDGNNRFFW